MRRTEVGIALAAAGVFFILAHRIRRGGSDACQTTGYYTTFRHKMRMSSTFFPGMVSKIFFKR